MGLGTERNEPLGIGDVGRAAEGPVRRLDAFARVRAAVALAHEGVQRRQLLVDHVGDVDEDVVVVPAAGFPHVPGKTRRAAAPVEHLRDLVGRTPVAGVDGTGQSQGEHHDAAGHRVGVPGAPAFVGEMGEDDIRLQLPQQAGELAHDRPLGQQHGVVRSHEIDVLHAEGAAGRAHLFRLHVRPVRHHLLQRIALRHLVRVEHLVADHLVVHAGPVGQHHAAHPVAPGGVMGHGPAGLVENVGRMRADGQDAKRITHDGTLILLKNAIKGCFRVCCTLDCGRQKGFLFPGSPTGRIAGRRRGDPVFGGA